jgi:uncharacterized membrane protein YhaH (DUF805 family)
MKDALDRWVSPQGRLSQRGYVLTFALPFAALVLLTWLGFFAAPDVFGKMPVAPLALGWLALLGVGDALNIKRWHDLGNSARIYRLLRPTVVLLPLLAGALYLFAPMNAVTTGDIDALIAINEGRAAGPLAQAPMLILGATGLGVAGNVIYLSLMPGQGRANEFGPDPRDGAAVFASGAAKDAGGDPVERALADYRRRTAEGPRPAPMVQPGGFGRKKR